MSQEGTSAQPSAAPEQSPQTIQQTTEQMIEQVGSPVDSEETDFEAQSEESAEESEDSLEATEQEIRELKKKLKLKVDGQEIEEEIDFEDDESLTRYLQKAKAFDKKAEETAAYRKQLESLVTALRENPAAILTELGLDVNELAYNQLQQAVEEAKKSPEQIEQERMARELEELRAEKERLFQEKQETEMNALRDQEAARIQEDIITELQSRDGLLSHDDPEVIGDIARAMLKAIMAGKDVSVKDVIPAVETRYLEKLRRRAEKWDEKTFGKVFGKKKMEALRKARLSKKAKVQTETARQIAQTGRTETKEETPKDKVSYRDFLKNLGR